MSKGTVYFIQEGYDNYFKIGLTANEAESRKNALQVGNSTKLRVFGKIETNDCGALEDELHDRFNADCERGEWFCVDPSKILDAIEEYGGDVCVDDPLKIKIAFDKEAFRKEIEENLKAEHRKEIERLKASVKKRDNLNVAMARAIDAIIGFFRVSITVAIIAVIAWFGYKAIKERIDRVEAKTEREYKLTIQQDSISRAESEKFDENLRNSFINSWKIAAKELDSLRQETNKVSPYDMFVAEEDYLLNKKAYFNYIESEHSKYRDVKDSTFYRYESLLDDSTFCESMIKLYDRFKKNSGDQRIVL